MLRIIISRFIQTISFIAPFGGTLRPFLHKLRGVKIGRNVWISKFVYIDENHPDCVFIGDNSTIGFRTSIFAHTYFGKSKRVNPEKVIIGKNVFIGPHCLILANVEIGDNSVIKGGTVVTRNVPPNTLYGYPNAEPLAKVTIPLTPKHNYEEFLKGLRPLRKELNKNKKQ